MNAARPASPATTGRRLPMTWTAYGLLALWAYLLYGLGNATPYLRADLRLSDFAAGLHGSALAVGVLLAGLSADAIGARFGLRRAQHVAVLFTCAGPALIAAAPLAAVSLAGAGLLGFGGGSLSTQVNVRIGGEGDIEARKLLGRANALAMLTAIVAPLCIAEAATILHAWRIALIVPIVGLLGVSWLGFRDEPAAPAERDRHASAGLPGRYWLVWAFLGIAVAIEFSFVFWGSTLVAARTGSPSAESTLLAALFVAGMFVGRAAIGAEIGAGFGSRSLLVAGIALSGLGAGLVWISTGPPAAGAGLFLGGVGTAGLYPVGVALALASAPGSRLAASARLTLASGMAALLAPSALGLAADAVGVERAWVIVPGLCAAGLALLAATRRPD